MNTTNDIVLENGDIQRTTVIIIPASQYKAQQDMLQEQADNLTAQIAKNAELVSVSQAKVALRPELKPIVK